MNGETFYNMEQYIKADKVASHNSDITRAKIMVTENPCEIKIHGSNVKGFIPQKWD